MKWNDLYQHVLQGDIIAPRGRVTQEQCNVVYTMQWWEHLDPRPSRDISLDYIKREFLWFCTADRYDTRISEYAPLWKTCIDEQGGINSNYGQYLFRPGGGFNAPFWNALDAIVDDPDTRRAWIPIFGAQHQGPVIHTDYPCTTGLGFRLRGPELWMNVHMRSQDLWHGAANDEPVCYLLQLLAVAYLRLHGIAILAGPITHYIDSLHFYERHWEKAAAAVHDEEKRRDVMQFNALATQGFSNVDLGFLFGSINNPHVLSPLLTACLDIPGAYGRTDYE